ncbi:DUF6886 family protein [Bacillus sp. CGMCC 1.16607]|uniref:DUF6886 family protein n=1 Tax=Bacillus sp. CGMCC 1.16607 TaxID=3351842 RepID=UPI003644A494
MLFHFSENPNIKEFIPLEGQANNQLSPVVWAIDEEHSVNYFLPRDCPRIIYSKSTSLSEEDEKIFFSQTKASTIMTVESDWLESIRNTTIYKYTFTDDGFSLFDRIAGYYVSYTPVQPLYVEPMHHLLENITSRGVELRITPNLYPLREAILKSTLENFSMIRMRNAKIR